MSDKPTLIPKYNGKPGRPPEPSWSPFETQPMLRCPRGHNHRLDHEIAADGTVSPSVDCPDPTCDFHTNVRLEEWAPP